MNKELEYAPGDVVGKNHRLVRTLYYLDELYDLKDSVVCLEGKIVSTEFVRHYRFANVCKFIRERKVWIVELINNK